MNSNEDSHLQDIEVDLRRLEDLRKGYFAIHRSRLVLGPILAVLGMALLLYAGWVFSVEFVDAHNSLAYKSCFSSMIIIMGSGIAYRWMLQPKQDYIRAFKSSLFSSASNEVGNVSYCPHGGLSLTRITPSKIIPPYDQVKKEDYFRGEYKGVKFELVEMALSSSKKMFWHFLVGPIGGSFSHSASEKGGETFCGVVVLLSMKRRKFYGHTVVLGSFQEEKAKLVSPPKGFKEAKFVDPAFNSQFRVYTNDQVEARYLSDPHIMQKITDMRDHYRGDAVNAAYYDSKMLIMISSDHNHFEPPDIGHPVSKSCVLMMRQELQDIIGIIDYLEMQSPAVVQPS